MDRYLTAQEIADAAAQFELTCMPHSKRSVNRRARDEGWADAAQLSRHRAGASGGGAVEYHVSLLPQQMQDALAGDASKAVAKRNTAERRDVERARRAALDTTDLTARQRDVMNARAAVLGAIEAHQVASGLSRSKAVLEFLNDDHNLGLGDATLLTAKDRRNGAVDLHRATILRWFQFRDASGVGALAPKPTKAKADIPDWFWGFMKHYARPQKPCITEALDAYLVDSRTNQPVTYDKVRYILNTKLGNVERHRGREGSLTLKARLAYVQRDTSDLLPTCIFTADGKTFDAEVAHPLHGRPFRPEITSVVDVATRKCVGFSIGLAENAVGVVDALRFACEQHGIPAIFYVDRGSGFKNGVLDARVTGLMGRLGITKHHSIAQNSQARGIIERFNGSVWNKLSREYQTFVGALMDRQARQRSFKRTRKEIKEFGTSASLPSWDAFMEACRDAVAAYNEKPHAALPGRMSPNEYWQHHVENGFEPVSITQSESDDLFRPYERRKVRRCLIEFNTNTYFHAELQEFDGAWVLVGYDIHDANHVWVRDIDTVQGVEQPGRLICIAKFGGNSERYVPLTMERKAMEERARSATKRAKERLQTIQEELDPPHALNHAPEVPVPDFAPAPAVIDAEYSVVGEGSDVVELRQANAAPRFATDAELALWAIQNPDDLHKSQVGVLVECVNDPSDRQLLIDHGVDVDALIDILKRAA